MNKKLIPSFYAKSVLYVDIKKLLAMQITNVFLDLDNTLANPYVETPSIEIKNFLQNLIDNSLNVYVVSNNHEPRVKKFLEGLNIKYLYEVKKPKTKRLLDFIDTHNIDLSKSIYIGDQIMTDVLVANKLNIKVILVEPLTKQDEPITFIPRLLDKHYRKKLAKKYDIEVF